MELLALRSDLAFRAVFGRENEKCKKALTALLNDVLDLHITTLSYANPLNLQNYDEDKKSEMDIEVVTDSGERIDIEIQLLSVPGFANRMIYYGSKLINECLSNGEGYEYMAMKKCKVLSIVDFTLFANNQRLQNRFRMKELEDNFELSDVLELIFLEMSKLDEAKPLKDKSPVERWLYFLKYVDDATRKEQIAEILYESEGITMAMEVLKEVSADDQLRTKIRLQEKAENDWKARIYYAKQEGIAKGRAEGEAKGRAEGEAVGVAKGRVEGEREKQLEIARKALTLLDDDAIAQLTGLESDEVALLRADQKLVASDIISGIDV